MKVSTRPSTSYVWRKFSYKCSEPQISKKISYVRSCEENESMFKNQEKHKSRAKEKIEEV